MIRHRRPTRFLLASCGLLACDLPLEPSLAEVRREVERRAGTLVAVEEQVILHVVESITYEATLTSSSGLVARVWLHVPTELAEGERRPGVVLLGGFDTGRGAVRLLPHDVQQVMVSPDYPAEFDFHEDAEALRRLDELRDATWDAAAILLLAADYLETRPEVDPERIALVGASLGGFFAALAAAVDERFRNVALLYTGGDLERIIAANGAEAPEPARRLGADLAALPVRYLEPTRYVPAIAPRPLLLVNGLHDDRIPHASARALMDAAREPKELVWLPTGHLEPEDTLLIRTLVDTAFARMPIFANQMGH